MKNWQLLTAVLVMSSCALGHLEAATLNVSIDGESVDVPLRYEYYPNRPGGYYEVGETPGQPFEFETSSAEGGRIALSGALDPDPSLLFGSVAFDFGAPSVFSFTFILPLSPLISNPSVVFDSFSGSLTNAAGSGVTLTALPPTSGVPVDGDGITEMQVFTLSDDGGATWKNVGLDLGPSAVFPLPVGGSAIYGPFSEGPIPTIPGGPWTHMRADITFGLSGGGDSFTFNGAKVLIPEPAAIVLAAVSLLGVVAVRKRRAGR